MTYVQLRCVRVLDDHVDLVLEADRGPVPTDAAERAAARLLEWLPGLASHRCSTGATHTFVEELHSTETPHLLEHVLLELLVCSGSPKDVRGETVWRTGDDAYCVSIFDDDDAVCLCAARTALRVVEAAFSDVPELDIDAEIATIAMMRDAEPSPARD